MRNTTFKSKFVKYFLIGLIISIVLIALFIYMHIVPKVFVKDENIKMNNLQNTANKIDVFIKKQISDIEKTKDSLEVIKTNEQIREFLEKRVTSEEILGELVFNNSNFTYSNIDLKKEDISSEILQKESAVVFEKISKSGNNNIYIGTNALINGEKGKIIVQIRNEYIKDLIKYPISNVATGIVGENGKKIALNENNLIITQKDINLINTKYQTLSNPIVKYELDEVEKVALVKAIPSIGWNVINIYSQRDFYYESLGTILKVITILLIYIIISLIITIATIRLMLKPLNKLVEGVNAVESGDLNYKIDFDPKDIFAEIAEGFNKMVERLSLNYKELQKQTEQLVERNWQVEEANSELEDSYQKLQETINQLNEAEEKYFNLVKNIPEIVCVIELDGIISFANDTVYDVLGYHKHELIGKNIDLILDPALTKKFMGYMNKRLKKENMVTIEIPMVTKSGIEIITEAKLTYHYYEGVVDGIQAIVEDITKKKKMQNEIMHKNEELLTIYNISKSLSSTIEIDNVFKVIVNEVCRIFDAEMCVLRLLDATGANLLLRAYSGVYLENVPTAEIQKYEKLEASKVGESLISKKIIQKEGFIPNGLFDVINKTLPEEKRVNHGTVVPICSKDKVMGIITVGSRIKISEKRLNILNSIANNAAVAIENGMLYQNSKKYFFKTIDALIAAVEAKDKYTEGHSQRVSKYAGIIARELKLPKNIIEDLEIAGILHDVGKIGITDNILLKPDRLSVEEYEEIKQHPIISNRILYSVGLSEITMKAIACHHERYDGKGYPFGLKGDELSLECQIIAVADAFDAMTSTRAYREALSFENAIEEILKNKGNQFGPLVVEAMERIYRNDFSKIQNVYKEIELSS